MPGTLGVLSGEQAEVPVARDADLAPVPRNGPNACAGCRLDARDQRVVAEKELDRGRARAEAEEVLAVVLGVDLVARVDLDRERPLVDPPAAVDARVRRVVPGEPEPVVERADDARAAQAPGVAGVVQVPVRGIAISLQSAPSR